MQSNRRWCPICSLPSPGRPHEKELCGRCAGSGEIKCSSCLCLDCGGTGKDPVTASCRSCSGVGYISECLSCSGSGTMLCPDCYGSGLAPGESLVSFALNSTLSKLLGQLPIVEGNQDGEPLEMHDTLRRILGFLGHYHWSVPDGTEAWEHELNIMEDRLHLSISALHMEKVSNPHVFYRFLDVRRTADNIYRVYFRVTSRRWW
jgi:hypothetical protein